MKKLGQFLAFGLMAFYTFLAGVSYQSRTALNFLGTGSDLDKLGQMLRDQQRHDEKGLQQTIDQFQKERERQQQEQERKDKAEHLKTVGAIVCSILFGLPALFVAWRHVGGKTLPSEAIACAYGMLGSIGGFWLGKG